MLITFSCKASGNIVMFGDVAKQMLKMMGYCESVPGAIYPEDIPMALAHLQQAINRVHQQEVDAQKSGDLPEGDIDDLDEQDVEPVIGLNTRALPLIEMLKAAEKEQCHIMWE